MATERTLEPAHRSSHADRSSRMRRRYLFLATGLLVGLVVGLALGVVLGASHRSTQPMDSALLTTRYQALMLTNGQTFVGKLEGLGSPFPVVYDVYTVQSQVDQESKEVTQALLSHDDGPMILNAQHILLVESVKPGSKLASLIEKAGARK